MRLEVIFSVVLGTLIFVAPVLCDENYGQPAVPVAVTEGEAIEVGNRICPISGEKIMEGKEVKIEYSGKIYNLCCAMCKKDFLKNPEESIKKLESELQK